MKLKKYQKRVILLFFFSFITYIIGCCLIPPLLKNRTSGNIAMKQTEGNTERVCVIDDNDDALLWRLRMIREAKEEIILVTFELRDDTSGQAIMAALLEAANRGVNVRLLIDGIAGELRLHDSENFKAFFSHENIKVKFYNPLQFTTLWKVNYRLHEKYLIIDNTAYLLGGRNTHDTYLGHFSENMHNDRDVVVYEADSSRCTSLSVLREYFEAIWDLEDCTLLSCNMNIGKQASIQDTLNENLEKLLIQYGYQITAIDWFDETLETTKITLLTGNPRAENKSPILWNQLCQLMKTASSNITIQTPLIVCDTAMFDDLKHICKDTISVQIFTNALENMINPLGADYLNQKSEILKTGSTIYEYYGNEPLHTKTLLIDDDVSVIGSYNLDARSTYLDTEIMLVINCPELNGALREQVGEIQNYCKMVEADGTISYGLNCTPTELSPGRKWLCTILQVIFYPFQYLL